jgi:fatty acid-binding protein DegV
MLTQAEEAMGYPTAEGFYIGGVIAINAGPDLIGVVYRKK